MKKAQVTLFMIMGIVALFAVGFLLYYLEGQSEIKKPEYTEVAPIRDFVESCISKTADEAFNYIGRQGGYIFESQLGLYPDLPSEYLSKQNVNGVDYDVPYEITKWGVDEHYVGRPGTPPSPFWGGPSQYPWIYFPYNPYNNPPNFNPSSAVYKSGPYGRNSLPPLNRGDGFAYSIQDHRESEQGAVVGDIKRSY